MFPDWIADYDSAQSLSCWIGKKLKFERGTHELTTDKRLITDENHWKQPLSADIALNTFNLQKQLQDVQKQLRTAEAMLDVRLNIRSGKPLEIEHIIPESRGGTDRVDNLTLACKKCNKKKGDKTAEEFGYELTLNQIINILFEPRIRWIVRSYRHTKTILTHNPEQIGKFYQFIISYGKTTSARLLFV